MLGVNAKILVGKNIGSKNIISGHGLMSIQKFMSAKITNKKNLDQRKFLGQNFRINTKFGSAKKTFNFYITFNTTSLKFSSIVNAEAK